MKKISLVFLAINVCANVAMAQTDAKAKAILNAVSAKYKSYNIIKSDFSFTLNNQQANLKETQNGTLYAKASANKYKVAMTNQELISDGKTQWTYLKKDKEVQVSTIDPSSEALNPAKIFTVYEKGFKYQFTGEKKVGNKTLQNIELTPIDAKKAVFKVKLSIDKAKKQLTNIIVYEKNGSIYTYHVKTFTPNVKVPETIFTFDAKKYPGIHVEDLR